MEINLLPLPTSQSAIMRLNELGMLDKENLKDQQDRENLRLELNKLYEDIQAFFSKWLDENPETYKKLAIGIIGTYFHDNFETFPYFYINAMRGSAKTRTLRIISHLQKNGDGTILNNPSESAVFRMAKRTGLVIDECEQIRKGSKETLRDILNSCYKKGGKVVRIKKTKKGGEENYEEEEHKLYTPVFIANINGIEEVLQDRCVMINLEKSNNAFYTKKIEDFETNEELKELKVRLNRVSVGWCSVWCSWKVHKMWNEWITERYIPIHTIHTQHNIHHSTSIHNLEFEEIFNKIDKTDINGRALELFFPLLLIAKEVEDFDDFLEIVKKANIVKRTDEFAESRDISVYEFISLQDEHRFEFVFVKELLLKFRDFIGEGIEEGKENWLTSEWFGVALKRLKLVKDKKRMAKGIMVFLEVDKAKEKIKMFKDKSPEEIEVDEVLNRETKQ